MNSYSVAKKADSATKYRMDRLKPDEIRIFHYNGEQSSGVNWIIIKAGRLYKVVSWSAEVPCSSVEDIEDILTCPKTLLDGREQLPRFHIQCSGSVSVADRHAHIEPIN